jgi:superfamily II RNA helicase
LQEGLIKVLFTTEPFAMSLNNMPHMEHVHTARIVMVITICMRAT